MDNATWMTYQSLLENCSPKEKEALKRYGYKSQEPERLPGPPFSRDFLETFASLENRLSRIHYSWLISFIEPFSEHDKKLILSALPPFQGEKLKIYFKIENLLESLTSPVKGFLNGFVYENLIKKEKEFLPFEYFFSHPLSPLLQLSKNQMQHLVDFLGLHDLSTELKQVLESYQIKRVYKALSHLEREYLKVLIKKKEPIFFARLNLEKWDGTQEVLKKTLLQRGFNRLAKALFGTPPALFWHLTHCLDTGRARILRKYCTDMHNKQAQEALIHQIIELIPLIEQYYE